MQSLFLLLHGADSGPNGVEKRTTNCRRCNIGIMRSEGGFIAATPVLRGLRTMFIFMYWLIADRFMLGRWQKDLDTIGGIGNS